MGRPLPGPGEPLFTEDDTQALLDFMEEERLKCSGCGMPRDETMLKEAQGTFKARALKCHACAERDRKLTEYTSGPHDASGLVVSIERRDGID